MSDRGEGRERNEDRASLHSRVGGGGGGGDACFLPLVPTVQVCMVCGENNFPKVRVNNVGEREMSELRDLRVHVQKK